MSRESVRAGLLAKFNAKRAYIAKIIEALANMPEHRTTIDSWWDGHKVVNNLNLIEELSREHKQLQAINEISGNLVNDFISDDPPAEKAEALQ